MYIGFLLSACVKVAVSGDTKTQNTLTYFKSINLGIAMASYFYFVQFQPYNIDVQG